MSGYLALASTFQKFVVVLGEVPSIQSISTKHGQVWAASLTLWRRASSAFYFTLTIGHGANKRALPFAWLSRRKEDSRGEKPLARARLPCRHHRRQPPNFFPRTVLQTVALVQTSPNFGRFSRLGAQLPALQRWRSYNYISRKCRAAAVRHVFAPPPLNRRAAVQCPFWPREVEDRLIFLPPLRPREAVAAAFMLEDETSNIKVRDA